MIIRFLALVVAVTLGVATPAGATPSLQDQIFDPGCVSNVELTAPQASIDALTADPTGDYQPATMKFMLCGATPQQIGPVDVTFRLKGHGSFRPLTGKAAIKIKIPKAGRGALGGLKSLTLNNQIQDYSAIHEPLAYSAFRAIGIPAIRAGYANLSINGAKYGLHANVESTDDRYLDVAFPGWSHLYEPQDWSESPTPDDFDSRDIIPDSVANFQIQEGDENVSDLTATAAIMDIPADSDWWAAFQQKFDANEALKFWALEYYLGDSDNYVTFTNNYFLVSSGTGVFSYLPWGTDKTFTVPSADPASLFPTWSHSIVVNRCLNYAPCRSAYRAALTDVAETILSMDLVDTAHQLYRATAANVKADQRKETTTLYSCQAVNSTISFLVGRATLWENSFRDPTSGISTAQTSTPLDCSFLSSDHTAPQVTVSTPVDKSMVKTPNVTLLYEAIDNSGVAPACTRDRGSIVALSPGENQISFKCSDASANAATISMKVTLDTTLPEVNITAPIDGATTDASTTLHFTDHDDLDPHPDCDKADGDTVALNPGSNTITVDCTDAAGNIGTDSVTVIRDNAKPEVDITAPIDGATTDASTTLHFTDHDDLDQDPDCDKADGDTVALNPGSNTITVDCTDAAGNIGTDSVTVIRDNDAPVISGVSPVSGLTTTDAALVLTYVATDNSGAAPNCTLASGTRVDLAVGINAFAIRCSDVLGNTGSVSVTYMRVLKTPATVTIDSGQKYAHRFGVRLKLSWPDDATRAKISNYKTFRSSRTIKAPKRWIAWRLPRRGGLRGTRKVYVKFIARDGAVVARASDTIKLSPRRHRR